MKTALYTVAFIQLFIASLNLFLPKILSWEGDLKKVQLLFREVFHVHSWFVSLTLTIFAIMSLRFADEILDKQNIPLLWLMGAIGIFWTFRTILQVVWYSSSHWVGRLDRTLIHIACLMVYGGMGLVYLTIAYL